MAGGIRSRVGARSRSGAKYLGDQLRPVAAQETNPTQVLGLTGGWNSPPQPRARNSFAPRPWGKEGLQDESTDPFH